MNRGKRKRHPEEALLAAEGFCQKEGKNNPAVWAGTSQVAVRLELQKVMCCQVDLAGTGDIMDGIKRKWTKAGRFRGIIRFCWKGSYTVEAALVLPVVLFVLSALMILAFYVHDRGILQSLACETAVTGNNYITEEERKTAVERIKGQVSPTRLMGSRGSSGHAAFGSSEVYVQYTAVYPVPGMAMRYLSGGRLKIAKSWRVEGINPSDWIRKQRGIRHGRDGGSR